MASPECVYPWWGRNMVDDPEKHIDKPDNIGNMIPRRQIKPEERKGKRTKEVEETFASSHTYPSTNMQVRVITQLLFEAFNAWACVDTI